MLKQKKRPAHAAAKRRPTKTIIGISTVLLLVIAAAAVVWGNLTQKVNSAVVYTAQLKNQDAPQSDSLEIEDSFDGRSVNFLIMGSDSRVGQADTVIDPGGSGDETMRADTTLILHIPADRTSVTLVSIPRDLWVEIPQCIRSDGSISKKQWGQFNWAFAYGSGGTTEDLAGAVACTEKTVEQITGIPLDGFAVVDFTGFTKIVDALGGIEVCLENELSDSKYLQVAFPAGCQNLNGAEATNLARLRYGDNVSMTDGSDMARIQRQQKVIGAMATKAFEGNILTSLPSLYKIAGASLDATSLSPSLGSVPRIVGLALSLKDLNFNNIQAVTVPVVTADFDRNRLLLKEPQASELWEALKSDGPLPEGTVLQNMNGETYTVSETGDLTPGGHYRTDDEIGHFQGEEG